MHIKLPVLSFRAGLIFQIYLITFQLAERRGGKMERWNAVFFHPLQHTEPFGYEIQFVLD